MTAAFAAEAIKIRKRPATWVLGAILVATVVLLGYVATYFGERALAGDPARVQEADILRRVMLTENVVPAVLNVIADLGGPIALILGAMVAGSEYGWNTLKMILTQRPGRLSILSEKALALGVVLAVLVALTFTTAFAASVVVAQFTDATIQLPGAWEVTRGLGAAWLSLGAWMAIGFALAVLLRGTTLAVGLGLIYGLVIENLISGFAGMVDLLETVSKALPGPNAGALAGSFTDGIMPVEADAIGTTHAVLVLAAYVLGSVAVAALALSRRDVA